MVEAESDSGAAASDMRKCDSSERNEGAGERGRSLAQADLFENRESVEFGGGTGAFIHYDRQWTFSQGEAKYRSLGLPRSTWNILDGLAFRGHQRTRIDTTFLVHQVTGGLDRRLHRLTRIRIVQRIDHRLITICENLANLR